MFSLLHQITKLSAVTRIGAVLAFVASIASAQINEPMPLFVEGYTDQLSYLPGQEVGFHVSATAKKFDIEIQRLGGRTLTVHKQSGIRGTYHPVPDKASSHGCNWPVALKFAIPKDWQSGYYQVTFTASEGGGRFIRRVTRTTRSSTFFVVRSANPGKDTKILIQLATNTYNAYTNWGGHSLYSYHDRNKMQGHRVSFNRPISSQFAKWEYPFVQWAENAGYKIDYAVNSGSSGFCVFN